MWSTLKRSSAAKLGHDKRDISAFDTVLFHSNLSSLRRKFLSDVSTDKIVLSCGPKVSEKPLKRRYWWLKNKERKFHFRFLERRFLAAINFTGSAEGALVPVLLRITHWPKSGLPAPGLFPPWSCRRHGVSLLYATKSAFTAPNLYWACALASPVTFLTGDHVMQIGFGQISPSASSTRDLGTRLP